MRLFAWLISRIFLANEHYFFQTKNQLIVLSVIAYQPSEQGDGLWQRFPAKQTVPSLDLEKFILFGKKRRWQASMQTALSSAERRMAHENGNSFVIQVVQAIRFGWIGL